MRARRLRGGWRHWGLAAAVGGAVLPVTLAAAPARAADTDIQVTEVTSRASSSSLGDDWLELTNTGAAPVDVTGWRVDDDSNSFASGAPISGVTSIAPGESVVLVTETSSGAPTAFANAWFGGTLPAGLQVGWLDGSGLGLSSGGDQINVFDAAGTAVANVSFPGHAGSVPFASFDNSAAVQGPISALSEVGVNGAFLSSNGEEIGSPGTVASTPPSAGVIRVTEVAPRASSTPFGDDWFELTNVGHAPVDITGWRADDDSNSFASAVAISGVSAVAPGESVIVVTELSSTAPAAFATAWFGGTLPAGLQVGWANGSGLGLSNDGDSVNIFNALGERVARVAFGSAPSSSPFGSFDNSAALDGVTISTISQVGVNLAFVSSNGGEVGSPGTATIDGGPPPGPEFDPWPGSPDVRSAENFSFGADMSGIDYEASGTSQHGVLWAARNKAGTMFRLVFDGTNWVPDTANDWGAGKELRYPGGVGHPDSEGITFAGSSSADGVYIASERDNDRDGASRNAVLRYDVAAPGSALSAAQEWNLTSLLPATGANLGLEAITWIDDAHLVAGNFLDRTTGQAYDPARYPNHGDGLFLVSLEQTAQVYAFALATTGEATLLSTFPSELALVSDLQYDREHRQLWAECDNSCAGRLTVLELDPATGTYAVTQHFERPANLGNNNNEGFAISDDALCVDNLKPVWWTDDGETGGLSIIEGQISCTPPPVTVAVTVDPAAPDGENGWYRTPVTVVADATPDAIIEFALDGAGFVADADGNLIVDSDGEHTLAVRAVRDGQPTPATNLVLPIDATAPDLAVAGVMEGQTFAAGGSQAVTWTTADVTSGPGPERVDIDGVTVALAPGGPFLPGSLLAGQHQLTVDVADQAGNHTGSTYLFDVAPAWNIAIGYQSGDRVSFNGVVWEALWPTAGQQPGNPRGAWQQINPADADGIADWAATTVYGAGDLVRFEGVTWEALWYSRNDTPGDVRGPWSQRNPVDDDGIADWAPSTVYDTGDRVYFEGATYEAMWYSRGDEPGGRNSPWLLIR